VTAAALDLDPGLDLDLDLGPDAGPGPGRLVYVALGDSVSAGVGDGLALAGTPRHGPQRGWARVLGTALDAARPTCTHVLAHQGARAADVRRHQVPVALALRPGLATVLVGGNDLLRGDFDVRSLQRDVLDSVVALQAAGALTLVVALHDPSRVLRLPHPVARVVRRRAAAVNATLREVARQTSCLLVEPHREPSCYRRDSWHVDRLHPSSRGHTLLARTVAERLRQEGWQVGEVPDDDAPVPTRGETVCWLVRYGTPWLARRARDLLPTLAVLAAREAITAGRGEAGVPAL
jgi:lysophospholipase L1-like esterase